jgi:cytochrome P450
MSRLTLEIAARALLSFNLSYQSETFGAAMDVLNESMGSAHPGDPEVQRRFGAALATIRQIVWQAVLARRLYDTGQDDVVAVLLKAQRERGDTDRAIADQAVTMLLAGHETTAKAMSWTFALLDRHPAESERLLMELEGHLDGRPLDSQDVPRLVYTQAVIHESLRLYPPIWLLSRVAVADDQIEGYSIPEGTTVVISPYLMHRHPDLWDRPNEFLPERFLDEDVDSVSRAYRYLPFSTGPRHCIGKDFALLEMPIVLATVWARCKLTLPADHPLDPEALVTLRPRHGLPMRMTIRSTRAFVPEGKLHDE